MGTQSGVLTFESHRLVFTGQVFNSLGNHEGSLADSLGNSFRAKGWNTFVEFKFWNDRMSIFGSYGLYRYTDNAGIETEKTREILGVAYHIYRKNKLVIDFNRGGNQWGM